MATRYINKPGSVTLHTKHGVEVFRYGDKVDTTDLEDYQQETVNSVTSSDRPDGAPSQSMSELIAEAVHSDDPNVRAAFADRGQPNSSVSPVPSNYAELDTEERVRFVRTLDGDPRTQAAVLEAEVLGDNSGQVLDAGTDEAKELVELRVKDTKAAVKDVEGAETPPKPATKSSSKSSKSK